MAGLLSAYEHRGKTTDEAAAADLNLDPNVTWRATMPFIPRVKYADGTEDWGIPQSLIDLYKAVIAPGHAARGGKVSYEDALNVVSTVGAGGLLAKRPAGSLGVFGGVNARNAPLKDLAKAEAMEAAGDHADDIWRSTGWGRGADGKWRFEIDDSGVQLSDGALGASLNAGKYRGRDMVAPLDDVMWHEDLSNGYDAGLGRSEVRIGHYASSNGAYDPADGSISVKAANPDDARSLLLHEAQHAVQRREGFARGGNPSTARGEARAAITEKRPSSPDEYFDAQRFSQISAELKPLYRADYLMDLERLSKADNIRPSQFHNLSDYYRYGRDYISKAGPAPKKAGAERDAWYRAGFKYFHDRALEDMPALDRLDVQDVRYWSDGQRAVKNKIARLTRQMEKHRAGFFAQRERATEFEDLKNLSDYEIYKRIAGEVEARNVQTRRDWTPEQRRETPPWATEDVPREQQIVRGLLSGGKASNIRYSDGEPIKGLLAD